MLNTMNYLWGFNFQEAIDPKTNEHIPVDINDFSEVINLASKVQATC